MARTVYALQCEYTKNFGKFEYIEVYELPAGILLCFIAQYSFVTVSRSKESLGDKAHIARKGGKVNT